MRSTLGFQQGSTPGFPLSPSSTSGSQPPKACFSLGQFSHSFSLGKGGREKGREGIRGSWEVRAYGEESEAQERLCRRKMHP